MRAALRITAFAVFVLITLSSLLSGTLNAMSWPSDDAVLVNNFGSSVNGKPVLGMVFNGGTEILAVDKGEIIFYRDKNDTASKLPSPLGTWIAVDHEDGLISIYSRLAEISAAEISAAESDLLMQVEKSQPIASSGVSGWSEQNGFYFLLFDRKDRHWINPAMIIKPVLQSRPLQVLSINLRNAQGALVQSNNINQGRYTILVNTINPAALSARGNILAPQRIICLVNGAEAGVLNFEAFSARDGTLMIYRNGLVPVRQIYSSFPAFEAAEVFMARGQANLEVIVQDAAGNSSSMVSRLVVN